MARKKWRSVEFSERELQATLDACSIEMMRERIKGYIDPDLVNVVRKLAKKLTAMVGITGGPGNDSRDSH